jgi:protein AbiQ
MKNGLDFHRILDSKGKLIGVLDFNNMIPVRTDTVQKIQLQANKNDTIATLHYKELLKDQLTFCRQNHDIIVKKANKLYRLVHQKNTSGQLKRRCLNWSILENILDHYNR